jgi:hypothetical protein
MVYVKYVLRDKVYIFFANHGNDFHYYKREVMSMPGFDGQAPLEKDR